MWGNAIYVYASGGTFFTIWRFITWDAGKEVGDALIPLLSYFNLEFLLLSILYQMLVFTFRSVWGNLEVIVTEVIFVFYFLIC